MTTSQMYDGAWPPSSPPAWPVVAGYLGGDTPHVWTAADWASQPARYRLPIWVRSNPAAVDATQDIAAAVAAARAAGVPRGATVALDLETAVAPGYVSAFNQAMTSAGYWTLAYGSAGTVTGNPPGTAGYWTANWTGAPHLDPGAAATQYASGATYDASVISTAVPLWDTRPTTTPAPPATSPETDMPRWDTTSLPTGRTVPLAVPQGTAWAAWPSRALHLVADDYPGTVPEGTVVAHVRVAAHHPGAGWAITTEPVATGAPTRLQVDGADVLSLDVLDTTGPTVAVSASLEVY